MRVISAQVDDGEVIAKEIIVEEEGLPNINVDFSFLVSSTLASTFSENHRRTTDYAQAIIMRYIFKECVGKNQYAYEFQRFVV